MKKKLLIIYKSGAKTTVEYDETEKHNEENLYEKLLRNMCNLDVKTIVWLNGVAIRADRIDHMEVLK
jgi:hypothetical protein